jgi:pimeloyl-ACP methyl ester carboxylesterase
VGRVLATVTAPDALGLFVLLSVAAALIVVAGALAILDALRRPPRKTYGVALARGLATEPGQMGYAWETLEVRLDARLGTEAWILRGQDPGGPAVVVVHGFGDSRYGALTWAPLLAPHASQIVLYDLRGHGESAGPAGCGIPDVDDLLAVLDHVDPPGPVVLFGLSMGGGIAIAAAAREPERVAGVVVDGAYRTWDEPIKHHLWNRRLPAQPFVGVAGFLLRLMGYDLDAFDRRAHASRLKRPLLVLHGAMDHLCPLASARELAEAAPDAELVVFERGRHLDLPAAHGVRYREALRRFFARLSLPATAEKPATHGIPHESRVDD